MKHEASAASLQDGLVGLETQLTDELSRQHEASASLKGDLVDLEMRLQAEIAADKRLALGLLQDVDGELRRELSRLDHSQRRMHEAHAASLKTGLVGVETRLKDELAAVTRELNVHRDANSL